MEDTIKEFTISAVFILICSVALILFVIEFPAMNGKNSVLIKDPQINETAQALVSDFGSYQSTGQSMVVSSTNSSPQLSANGIQLVSTVSNTRTTMSTITGGFNLVLQLVSNELGFNSGALLGIGGVLIFLFLFLTIYYSVKWLRQGA